MKYLVKGLSIAEIEVIKETDKTYTVNKVTYILGWVYVPSTIRKSDNTYAVCGTLIDALTTAKAVAKDRIKIAKDLLAREENELQKIEDLINKIGE